MDEAFTSNYTLCVRSSFIERKLEKYEYNGYDFAIYRAYQNTPNLG
jgi:hypothetical protein